MLSIGEEYRRSQITTKVRCAVDSGSTPEVVHLIETGWTKAKGINRWKRVNGYPYISEQDAILAQQLRDELKR